MSDHAIFKKGVVKLHSGIYSHFKIDCDSFTDEDWECLAFIISKTIKFSTVIGVPSGGKKLEQKLIKYQTVEKSNKQVTLIVDDVLTTGNSMNEIRKLINTKDTKGVVVFARGTCPNWITPIFQISKPFMSSSDRDVQVSDTTGDASSNADGQQKQPGKEV